jgi:hypothetical protein
MPRFVLTLIVVGLSIYALIDCLQTPTPRNLPKSAWLLVIILVPVIGPVLWLIFGRVSGGGWGRGDDEPTGPDDDPSFLKDFDRSR